MPRLLLAGDASPHCRWQLLTVLLLLIVCVFACHLLLQDVSFCVGSECWLLAGRRCGRAPVSQSRAPRRTRGSHFSEQAVYRLLPATALFAECAAQAAATDWRGAVVLAAGSNGRALACTLELHVAAVRLWKPTVGRQFPRGVGLKVCRAAVLRLLFLAALHSLMALLFASTFGC